MDYQSFEPHPDLSSIVKCYWTLKVPAGYNNERQRIVPDGSLELAFILGEDIKRFTNETAFILQPRAMVLGQTVKPFYIQPTGVVDTFAIQFYPYGFANLIKQDVRSLIDKETPIQDLFGKHKGDQLYLEIFEASDVEERIAIINGFLLDIIKRPLVIDKIVKSTVDLIAETNGGLSITEMLKKNPSIRRKLERKFSKQVGLSPKQLGRVIRLQTALKLILGGKERSLTQVAYQADYYDQAHFIKDFKTFTGNSPKGFLESKELELSSLFYSKD